MIKFFRHIRQRLLTENKFSKYLLYAIGEIILVAIGILIALQVNNWNNHRIAEIEGYEILTEFRKELIGNLNQTTAVIKDLKQDVLAKERLFKINDFETMALDSLWVLIFDVNVDVLPNQKVFEKVKNKNITKLTDNLELNTLIFEYFNRMDLHTKSINFFWDKHKLRMNFYTGEQNSIDVYQMVKIDGIKDLSEKEEKNRLIEFISSPRVTNQIKEAYYHEGESARRLDWMKIEMYTLLEGIQEELKKTKPNIEPLPENLLAPISNFHLDQKELMKYVGNYKDENKSLLNIQIKNNQLHFIDHGFSCYLTPTGRNQFDIKHSIVRRIEFVESANGLINGMTFIELNDKYQYIKK